MKTNSNEVPSPCIRNCCLDRDDVCLGCFRTLQEITGWSEAAPDERRAVLKRCDERRQAREDRLSQTDLQKKTGLPP